MIYFGFALLDNLVSSKDSGNTEINYFNDILFL